MKTTLTLMTVVITVILAVHSGVCAEENRPLRLRDLKVPLYNWAALEGDRYCLSFDEDFDRLSASGSVTKRKMVYDYVLSNISKTNNAWMISVTGSVSLVANEGQTATKKSDVEFFQGTTFDIIVDERGKVTEIIKSPISTNLSLDAVEILGTAGPVFVENCILQLPPAGGVYYWENAGMGNIRAAAGDGIVWSVIADDPGKMVFLGRHVTVSKMRSLEYGQFTVGLNVSETRLTYDKKLGAVVAGVISGGDCSDFGNSTTTGKLAHYKKNSAVEKSGDK